MVPDYKSSVEKGKGNDKQVSISKILGLITNLLSSNVPVQL